MKKLQQAIMKDKESYVELITRDVSPEILNQDFEYIDPNQEMMEEDFNEAISNKLRRWNIQKLKNYYEKHRYK